VIGLQTRRMYARLPVHFRASVAVIVNEAVPVAEGSQ